MMKIIPSCLLALSLLFCSVTLQAQQTHTLKGSASGMAGRKVELLDFYGDKNRVVSSTSVDKDGLFQFPFNDKSPAGMYRLKFAKGRNVDVIYNHYDIELSISKPVMQAGQYTLFEGIDVLSSLDNSLYYGFLKTLDLKRKRTAHLTQLKRLYPPSKDKVPGSDTAGMPVSGTGVFAGQVESELYNLHQRFEEYVHQLIEENPDSYSAKFIKNMKTPVPNPNMTGDGLREWQKEHFWDSVDLSDTTLLHSPLIPSKVFEYISLYGNKSMNREEQEMAFVGAVDDILLRARVDDEVFSVVLDIVVRKFEKSEFELVLTYITENYILADAGCEDSESVVSEDRVAELRKKVETIKKMAVGNPAPEIEMFQHGVFNLNIAEGAVVPLNNTQMKMSNISAENTLILFWASWCPHCPSVLTALKSVYDEYRDRGLEIVAISLDKERAAWQNAITEGQYNWVNYSELTGWEGTAATEYGVWSTPRMYLLDSSKKIIAKPGTVKELVKAIAPLKLARVE
ncbi:MAG: redoxin domain-containing protein [Candidatus Scalindua sp.]|nr:redoxin domain-containing protein [Candidatus Scalindua sp.]